MSTLGTWTSINTVRWATAWDGYSKPVNTSYPQATYSSAIAVPYTKTAEPRITFQSRYKTFQVRRRYRRRLGPLNPDLVTDSNLEEQWTEWSDWAGYTEDKRSNTDYFGKFNANDSSVHIFNVDYSFPYAVNQANTYDMYEYEVQVRPFDEPTLTHGQWVGTTLRVLYMPTFSIISSELQGDGSVVVTYETKWHRNKNRFGFYAINVLDSYGYDSRLGDIFNSTVNNLDAFEDSFIINKKYFGGKAKKNLKVYVENASFISEDMRKYGVLDNKWTTVNPLSFTIGASKQGGEIEPPFVTYRVTATKTLLIDITRQKGNNYNQVVAWVTYTDIDGSPVTLTASMKTLTTGTLYTGTLVTPPMDVPLTIKVGVINNFGFEFREIEAVVRSDGMLVWNSQDLTPMETVCLHLEADRDDRFEPEVETEKPAGRLRPISRRGEGGVRTIQASGQVWNQYAPKNAPRVIYSENTDIEKLEKGTTWIYRAPRGRRHKVVINSVNTSYAQNTFADNVSVSMEETL